VDRDIKLQRSPCTITKFPTTPLHVTGRTVLTVCIGEVRNFIRVKTDLCVAYDSINVLQILAVFHAAVFTISVASC